MREIQNLLQELYEEKRGGTFLGGTLDIGGYGINISNWTAFKINKDNPTINSTISLNKEEKLLLAIIFKKYKKGSCYHQKATDYILQSKSQEPKIEQ